MDTNLFIKNCKNGPPETLLAIGVVKHAEANRIVDAIIELTKEKEKNRESLTNILVWLVSAEVPIDDAFKRIEELPWVPTTDGEFQCPRYVVIPSQRNKEVMGESHGSFLDYTLCSPLISRRAKERTSRFSEERLRQLGFKIEPDVLDMLTVVAGKHNRKIPPAIGLFDMLSEKIGSQNDYDPLKNDYGYYYNGQWISSSQIRIMDEKAVPNEIRQTLIIINPKTTQHLNYLLFDGAKTALSPHDFLKPLVNRSVIPSVSLWNQLANYESDLDPDHKELYGNRSIYPIDNRNVAPSKIICIGNENSFLKEGAVGNFFAISYALSQQHGKILKKLGAKSDSELSREDILHLIGLTKQEQNLDNEQVEKVLLLIKRVTELAPAIPFPNEALWPARKGGNYIWMKPRNCYLMDSSIAEVFEKEFAFLCVDIRGKVDESLKEYAIKSGSKKFSDHLTKTPLRNIGVSEPDKDLTTVLNELSKALSLHFAQISNSAGCFNWLSNAEGHLCEELNVLYSIPALERAVDLQTSVRVPKYAIVEKEGSKWSVWAQLGNLKSYDQLADVIVEECIAQGFPNEAPDFKEIRFLVYKLLTHPPTQWNDLIEDYVFSGETTSFGSCLSAFPSGEGGAGYLQTRAEFQRWYGCCQICHLSTPRDEEGIETLEMVKSVVSFRGGRYRGLREGYSPENCLFLCPRHQTLYERGLVKFAEFERGDGEEITGSVRKTIQELKQTRNVSPNKIFSWYCYVFEGQKSTFDEEGTPDNTWQRQKMCFTLSHLISFLENMLRYMESLNK